MDERIQIWNILHDGEITAISEDGDTLTMFVSIPYLRRRLKPLGDSFVLTLAGVTRAECCSFDGPTSPLRDVLDMGIPEIFQTRSESMPVAIKTSMGGVMLDFQTVHFALDTGQPVEFQTIKRVCEEYWSEWRAKSGQSMAETSE